MFRARNKKNLWDFVIRIYRFVFRSKIFLIIRINFVNLLYLNYLIPVEISLKKYYTKF
jgi:hypothetical protein